MFTLVLIGSARRLAHRIFFFCTEFFFSTAVSFEIMSYYFFQKLELTADEQNRHPGELSRATFEVSLWGLGKILAWWSNKHSGSCLCLSPLIFWNKSNNHKICKLTELYKRKCIALEQWGDKVKFWSSCYGSFECLRFPLYYSIIVQKFFWFKRKRK